MNDNPQTTSPTVAPTDNSDATTTSNPGATPTSNPGAPANSNPAALDFTGYTPTWCAGCGNWGIGRAVTTALSETGLTPDQACLVFDIGCSGNMNDFVNAYAMHTLHGRSLATAIGVKLANPSLPVIVIGGDGSLYGEGGNHFLHACRANHDMTVLVHDNSVYGLTKGQPSPRTPTGYTAKVAPNGVLEQPSNSLAVALLQGATFVAQTFAGNMPHLVATIKAGVAHRGLSIINMLQPCVTFNKVNTYGYYFQKTYQLQNHDASNFDAALATAQQPVREERFPLGVIYQVEKPVYHELLPQRMNRPPLVHEEPRAPEIAIRLAAAFQ